VNVEKRKYFPNPTAATAGEEVALWLEFSMHMKRTGILRFSCPVEMVLRP
jgi:hypothetical protein